MSPEIRCRFVFSGKNDELTPDFPTPDFPGTPVWCFGRRGMILGHPRVLMPKRDQVHTNATWFRYRNKTQEVIPDIIRLARYRGS